ncbi:MAG: PAS domain S-box protein, partial [Thermoplasmata archaeon]
PNATVVFATDKILYANPAAVRMYGGDDESDLLGKRIFDLMPPEFAADTAARIRKMNEESVPVPPRRVKVYTKTGQTIDMEINSIPITFSGRKAFQTILRDVTEEMRAETLLRAHQEELRTIIDSVPAMISYQDVEGRFLRVNRSFAEATGIDEDLLRGRKVEDVLPGFGEMFSSRDKNVIETRRPLIGALTPYPAKQGVRWARTDKIPYVDAAGEVVGILTVAEDITERKKAEEDASRIKEQLEHLLSESSAVTYSCNAEDPFDATYVSPNVKRLYGHEPEEFSNNPGFWASMIHPDDSERVLRELQVIFEKGHHVNEYRWKKKDGTYTWIYDETRLIKNEEGVPIQMVGLWSDITDRKMAEDGLKLVNKKLNLLGGITRHDSLNQLTALKGWLTIAIEQESDDSVRDMLVKAEKAADSLKMHLDFTAQYKSLGMKRPGWMPLAEVVAKVTEGLGRQGISVSVEVEDVEIFADPMLENVFRNLVNNSIAHGGDMDSISFSFEQGEAGLVMIYEDNGVGIPAEAKAKIFARGYGKRHGYGLYLSWEILSITGMTLKETGIPTKGARFEISVPTGNYRRRSE